MFKFNKGTKKEMSFVTTFSKLNIESEHIHAVNRTKSEVSTKS